jgi:hypothetical protein
MCTSSKVPSRPREQTQFCERLVGTLRHEVLDRLLVLNHTHLMKVLDEYRSHYNHHRPHQSRAQRPPEIQANPPPIAGLAEHPVRRTPLLGGLINEYQHAA